MTLIGTGYLQAQDCDVLVAPRVGYNMERLGDMPKQKYDWYCAYSQYVLFEADEVPEGAMVFDISDLYDMKEQAFLTADFVVDLNTMSYYRYYFKKQQVLDYPNTIYYRTPASAHPYLGVRGELESMRAINSRYEDNVVVTKENEGNK